MCHMKCSRFLGKKGDCTHICLPYRDPLGPDMFKLVNYVAHTSVVKADGWHSTEMPSCFVLLYICFGSFGQSARNTLRSV